MLSALYHSQKMPRPKATFSFYIFFFSLLLGRLFLPGFVAGEALYDLQRKSDSPTHMKVEGTRKEDWRWRDRNSRRLLIGSTAPTCTYNECRGCKYKCRAEQIPVDENDPINSAYRYRCVCHR